MSTEPTTISNFYANKEHALQTLIEAKKILEQNNCKYWLSDGTLLGAVRDKDFISHDKDIDIGVMAYEFTPEILRKFTSNGFKIRQTYGRPEDGLFITFEYGNIRIDIFLYYETPDNDIRYSCWRQFKLGQAQRIDYIYPKSSLIEIDFLGHKFMVPVKYEEYLELEYGPSWHVPNPNWDGVEDPFNKKYSGVKSYMSDNQRRTTDWLNRR